MNRTIQWYGILEILLTADCIKYIFFLISQSVFYLKSIGYRSSRVPLDSRHHLSHATVRALSEYKEHSLIFREAWYKGMREQKACAAAEWATPFQTKSCVKMCQYSLWRVQQEQCARETGIALSTALVERIKALGFWEKEKLSSAFLSEKSSHDFSCAGALLDCIRVLVSRYNLAVGMITALWSAFLKWFDSLWHGDPALPLWSSYFTSKHSETRLSQYYGMQQNRRKEV